jgi:thiol-disulfide isomerase/thioredoxin
MVEPKYGNDGATPANLTTHAHTSNNDPEGSEDPREIRKRAREAMKAAKAQLRATREPLPFNPWIMGLTIAGIVLDVVLAWGLINAQSRDTFYDNIEAPAADVAQKDAAPGELEIFARPVPAADISFVDAKGKSHALSDYKGQVVVLNVWASWCTPCKTEMPELAALQKRYADQHVKVLPVSIDNEDKYGDAKRFIGLNAPLSFQATGMDVVVKGYGISGMPATLIIDKQGREVARVNGARSWSTAEVDALMGKLVK